MTRLSPKDKPTLLELAERCEQATGPDREIDEAISAITLLPHGYSFPGNAPGYTRSLDAAMTLVPEGYGRVEFGRYVGVGEDSAERWCQITLSNFEGVEDYVEAETCATEALALCAAALRARAAQ